MDMTERIDQWTNEQREQEDKIHSKEYLNWLINFTDKDKYNSFDDDCTLYDNTLLEADKINVELISKFSYYIESLANKQRVTNCPDEDNCFEVSNFYFRIGYQYYHISTMVGQGSVTFIEKLEEEPNCAYVRVPY